MYGLVSTISVAMFPLSNNNPNIFIIIIVTYKIMDNQNFFEATWPSG